MHEILPVIADLSLTFFSHLISIEDDVEDKISTIGEVGGATKIKKMLNAVHILLQQEGA